MQNGEKKEKLLKIISEVTDTDVSTLADATNLVRDLQVDSVLRVELASRIEDAFGVAIDERKVNLDTTVGDLFHLLLESKPAAKSWKFKEWPLTWWAAIIRSLIQDLLVHPVLKLGVKKVDVRGLENLEDMQFPVVFMPNHVRYLDTAIVYRAIPRKIRKKTAIAAAVDMVYTRYKRYRRFAEIGYNAFPFPRKEGENIKPGLDYMGKMLDRGYNVVLFPEGKASFTGKLQPIKRGAGFIATEMNATIIPMKITGIPRIIPPDRTLPIRRDTVTVTFGKPIRFSKEESYIEATEKIYKAMQTL
ncbi:MAG: 1-acyl-sn-glycerol-3-phosphate acyltransferase [Candidatus Kerfeldbacteria bacterium]